MDLDTEMMFKFFSLFEIPDGHDLLLWTLNPKTQEKKSIFVQSADAAVEALKSQWLCHCYYGIGLRAHQTIARPYWRGNEQEITAILGFHLDVDLYHPLAHKNTNLPRTHEEILELLALLPIPFTTRTDTGHGEQPLFLFKEPEILEDIQDRNRAREGARQLHSTIQTLAAAKHWKIDSTYDLSRVLRVPGSINWKVENDPRLVKLLSVDGPRYPSISALCDQLPEFPLIQQYGPMSGNILSTIKQLSLQGLPPFSPTKLMALCQNNKLFNATWFHNRKDLADGSQSAYDFSIMLQALHMQLPPHEVAALVQLFRQEQKASVKDEGYYKFSIRNAMLTIANGSPEKTALEGFQHQEERAVIEAQARINSAEDANDTARLFQEVEFFFEFPENYHISKVLCIKSEPLQHEIIVACPDGQEQRIQIESPKDIYDWNAIRQRVTQVTGSYIAKGGSRGKRDQVEQTWGLYFNRMRAVAAPLEAPESHVREIIREALIQYAERRYELTDATREQQLELMIGYRSFTLDDKFWFSLSKFIAETNKTIGRPLTQAVYVKTLLQLSAERTDKGFRIEGGKTTSRKYWTIDLASLPGLSFHNFTTPSELENGKLVITH